MSFKKEDVEKIYNTIRVKHNTGKNAAYIPELKNVDPDIYAISICDIKGRDINVGDYNKKNFISYYFIYYKNGEKRKT